MEHVYTCAETHAYLKACDRVYRDFWRNRAEGLRKRTSKAWDFLDSALAARHKGSINQLHFAASQYMMRQFTRVMEKEFEYSRIRSDWRKVVNSQVEKRRLFAHCDLRLREFLDKTNMIDRCYYYGGIKTMHSLNDKAIHQKSGPKEDPTKDKILDLWDVVRFRIVCLNLSELLTISILIWEELFEDVVRCRNYYYRPRGTENDSPYRAIHFEIGDHFGNIFEIQVMSEFREVVSVLDHPMKFKKTVDFIDDGHRIWVEQMSKLVNILDFEALEKALQSKA